MLNSKSINFILFLILGGVLFFNNHALASDTATSTVAATQKYYLTNAPFVPQAPFGEWKDKRFQDGCEEMAALLAVRWAQGKSLTKTQARQEIIKISAYEQKKYGSYVDTSVEDTLARLIKGYFKYDKAAVKNNITVDDVITEIKNGNLVIAPFNGQKLKNQYYTAPGPERHMIVIRGYDEATNEFITNDAGTRRGENYRYQKDVLFSAIRDYPTGNHKKITGENKNIIVVTK